jgi:hypothetical protein
MRTIKEDPSREVIEIDGIIVCGWIEDGQCERCHSYLIYHEHFDALFCADCNTWKQSRCSDALCTYCRDRPERPLDG